MDPVKAQQNILDRAAQAATTALAKANIRHGFIGGYATSLIGGVRFTTDINLLVDSDPAQARQVLKDAKNFDLNRANKLVYKDESKVVVVEILQGGSARPLKLPDASSVPLHWVTPNSLPQRTGHIPIPMIAPSVLVLMKMKRWSFIVDSTRPQSIAKAHGDKSDVLILLEWLEQNNIRVDFKAWPENSKESMLRFFHLWLQKYPESFYLLGNVLTARDFALIEN